MPYIPENWRKHFDANIEKLTESANEFDLVSERAGIANYIISTIVAGIMCPDYGSWSYSSLSKALAVFRDAEAEMRRRLLDPYEDNAIEKNGDIPEYERH